MSALLNFAKVSEHVEGLRALATSLAVSNADDNDCVRQLREAAARSPENLRAAADQVLDFVGPESRASDRANRLLVAAWLGERVAPSTIGDEVFARIDTLYSVPVEVAYPQLVELQPRLEELNRQFSSRTIADDAKNSVWNELLAGLGPLIGPDADMDVTDPLLRTKAAHHIARLFLALRVGLLDEIEYN